ncbi:uncharacterized protein LOC143210468 [Lasioglossum baleicum]|uniref:uncharacterized protein LOC143210468 n=1 Tax=Lasioglossum baleicum TaxID=434251 RepID=UPI003FCED3BF
MVKKCCICKLQYSPDVTFHKIPKNEEVKLKWFAVIGRELKKYSTVCSNHFNERDFTYKVVGDNIKRFISPKAVPIIHGHSDSESVQSQTKKPNNSDNNNDVSIPQVDELHFRSNENSNDITLENQEDVTILKKSLLKRKSSDTQSLTSVKRVCNPRYVGDLTREDFTSDIAYRAVNDHLNY